MTSRSVGMPSGTAQPRPSPPSSRPTSPTSPELPRWRFKNASRKLGGYSSEWNDGKVFGGEEADEGAEEKVGFMEARARLKNVHDDEKRRKDAEFQGGSGVTSNVTTEDKQDNLKTEEPPEPEAPAATATDESSFDAAPDEASAQPADPEDTLSTANQEDDDRSLSTANSRAAQSHKSCFDELQTREGELLEEPKLAWGPNNEEMKGLMQSLGRLVYGNQEESDESEEEEISVVDEVSVADEAIKAEPVPDETQDVNGVNSTTMDSDDMDDEDEDADAEVQTINSGDIGGDADDDELDKIEKQEKLDDVDLTTEEEPSVEHEDELEKEKTTTEEPVRYSRRKKQLILLSILIVIIIVAVVLGVLLAGGNAGDGTCRADGEECVPNNCQNWKCGDTDCCCCGGLTCVADTGLGGERPMCA
ncbi:hypothetical protein ACHAXT_009025 [Thalassiosira profunda]